MPTVLHPSDSIHPAVSQSIPKCRTHTPGSEPTWGSPCAPGSCQLPTGLISPPPLPARAARGSPGGVSRKRMQMLQLESGAQETPSTTSPRSSATSWGSGWHCQGGQQPHRVLGMKTPVEKGKKQSHTWRIGGSPHIKTKKSCFLPCFWLFFLQHQSQLALCQTNSVRSR